ncbi:MAG: AraC family transcriptional regulator [Dechloromonas sp.]|uniref:AraC family transcriptional regulator n=1 Tax=Candidatus Dechloromonas phosphorivorans TaxID=2899244 RepID=A0A9D7LMV0_9RHOO|nr:AraC family transcriptional regulator [Candidatus Dechloromonas phosphorivorans]
MIESVGDAVDGLFTVNSTMLPLLVLDIFDNLVYPEPMESGNPKLNRSDHESAGRPRRQASVRVASVRVIPALLRNLGANPAEVLAAAGVPPELFDDPDNRISFALRSHLIRLCVDRTGCRHFGLLIGQQGGLHSLGLLGLLVQHSADVGSALRSLVRCLHHHVQGAVTALAVNDRGDAELQHLETQVEATDQTGDGAVAAMFNILRALCGADWKPVEVLFAHRRPDDVRPFQQFFRAPLRFDAEHDGVVFPADWLQRPLAGADAGAAGRRNRWMRSSWRIAAISGNRCWPY